MEDLFSHAKLYYPYSIQCMRGFPSYCPPSVHAQGHVSSGGGGGFGVRSVQSAYGEFIERSHFYLDVFADVEGKLSDYNSSELNASLYKMIRQLKVTPKEPESHLFKLNKVENCFDQTVSYLPTVMFTLSLFDSADRQFIPFMDSCGEATHISLDKAIHSSLMEFIERQALVGSWLTRQYVHKIQPNVISYVPSYAKLAKQLLQSGEIHVFNVCRNLPGYVVMILYFSHSSQDYVQYAIGMSAGLTPLEAMTKALNELWLDYGYLYVSSDVWKSFNSIPESKRYTIRHIEDNNIEKTKQIMAYNLADSCNIAAQDFLKLPAISYSDTWKMLRKITSHLYLYHRTDSRNDYHYTKMMSPDFFLHMSTHEKLNVDNAYTDFLSADLHHLYRKTIPFP